MTENIDDMIDANISTIKDFIIKANIEYEANKKIEKLMMANVIIDKTIKLLILKRDSK